MSHSIYGCVKGYIRVYSEGNFNAGVFVACESQIESTVLGHDANLTKALMSASIVNGYCTAYEALLRNQIQVYLPVNNALSPVGFMVF